MKNLKTIFILFLIIFSHFIEIKSKTGSNLKIVKTLNANSSLNKNISKNDINSTKKYDVKRNKFDNEEEIEVDEDEENLENEDNNLDDEEEVDDDEENLDNEEEVNEDNENIKNVVEVAEDQENLENNHYDKKKNKSYKKNDKVEEKTSATTWYHESTDIWVECINDSNKCYLPAGNFLMKFGSGNSWSYKEFTSSGTFIDCNSSIFGNPINWRLISGGLMNIDVGNKRVWGVNGNHDIFTRSDETADWVHIGGKLINISVNASGRVWGVNSNHDIFTRDGVNGNWVHIAGKLKNISVDNDGTVWGVNSNDDIFTRNGVDGNWVHIGGKLKNISVENGVVWGTNSADDIFTRNGVNGEWIHIPGKLRKVSVGFRGIVWGVNSADQIFTRNGPQGEWIHIPGSLMDINVGFDGTVWGVNRSHQIFIREGYTTCKVKNNPYKWVECARENGRCTNKKESILRYGSGSSWVYNSRSTDFNCNNGEFGDPAHGVSKICQILDDDFWKPCATQDNICSFNGTELVRYGANDKYNYRLITQEVNCSHLIFGDPIFGVNKTCDVHVGAIIWVPCGKENGTCKFTGEAIVRYGEQQSFNYRKETNEVSCSNRIFGDPLPGIGKKCEYAVYNTQDLPSELELLNDQIITEPVSQSSAVSFSTCQNTGGFGFNGRCLREPSNLLNADKAPSDTKNNNKYIFDILLNQALPFNGCIGDYLGKDFIENQSEMSQNQCNYLPLMKEFRYGLIGAFIGNVPCGVKPQDISFCMTFDRCGTFALIANAGLLQCAATYSTGIAAIISPFADILESMAFGISIKRRFTYEFDVAYRRGSSVDTRKISTYGHFFLQIGLSFPLSDLNIGPIKIKDFVTFNVYPTLLIDFGNSLDTVGNIITSIFNANRNTGKSIIDRIVKTNAEITFGIRGYITLNLNTLTNGFLPNIALNLADASILTTLGNGGASGLARGIYFYYSRGINNLNDLISTLMAPIRPLLSLFGVGLPSFNIGFNINAGLGLFLNEDSIGVTLVFPGISLYCLCIFGNKSCSCGVNGSFFTALLEAGKWLIKQARQIAETVGRVAVEFANEAGKFAQNAALATQNFFKNDVRNFFERDVKNALGSTVKEVGSFFSNDVKNFFKNDVGNFFKNDVKKFFSKW